jgi:acetylornithine deacetylase/succinyl-diaminopimelate desuccinylase-like protein
MAALVLRGHTDVVPAGDRALWVHDPVTPQLSGGVPVAEVVTAARTFALLVLRSAGVR